MSFVIARAGRSILGCLLAVLVLQGAGFAKEPESRSPDGSEMEGDRPDFTESPLVVPRGALQLEGGVTWTSIRLRANAFQAAEVALRYGQWNRTELRLALPNYLRIREDDVRETGMGDPLVGFKYQLGPIKGGGNVAVILQTSLPTGSRVCSSGRMEPEVKIPASWDIGERWFINSQLGLFWPSEGGERRFDWMPTVAIGRDLSDRTSFFVELYGWFLESEPDFLGLHVGVAHKITPRFQADVHFGLPLSSAAPDFFVGTGFVWRP